LSPSLGTKSKDEVGRMKDEFSFFILHP